MKKLTSAERTGLLLLAAALLVFLTVRFVSVMSRDEQIEPEVIETLPEAPAEALPKASQQAPRDTTAVKSKPRGKSGSQSSRRPKSSPSSRDYLDETIN